MDMNDEKTPMDEAGGAPEADASVTETPAPEAGARSTDGAYAWRSEPRRSYGPEFSEPNYVPRDQAPRTPRSYSYADPEIREKRRSWEEEERRNERRDRKRARRGMRAGGVIVLCLLFLLIGAGGMWYLSGGFHSFVSRVFTDNSAQTAILPEREPERALPEREPEPEPKLPEAAAPEEEEVAVPSEPAAESVPAPADEQSEKTAPVLSPNEEIGNTMAATEIYKLACQQVVGISTEVTYNTYFGTKSGTVSGTGFIITEDGYILTNHHVISYAAEGGYPITVMLYNGDSYPAEIVGYEDEDSDIAVLKISAEGLNPARLGSSEDMLVGETVYAVGNPLGELDYTMTRGMVSAMDREISSTDSGTGVTTSINMFQIDAAVNSGNSGGPVYNNYGEIIGIVTAKYADSYQEMGIEGLGFAIPIDDAVSIANELIKNGYVGGKAYMGVSTKTMSSMYAQYYNVPEGAYVYAVEAGSAAEKAGISMGDIVTAVDKTEIKNVSDLTSALKHYVAGESAVITVYRNGETLKLEISFDEKQPTSAANGQSADNPYGYYYYGSSNGGNHS